MRIYARMNKEEQFWRRVKKTESCWVWTGAKNDKGYGQFRNGPVAYYAHRFSYELHTRPLEKNETVLHMCDNPSCVNPDHLVAGSQLENIHDAMNKGRMCGHPITDEEVKEIKRLVSSGKYRQHEIAKMYGAHPSNISKIVNGVSRREVCYQGL